MLAGSIRQRVFWIMLGMGAAVLAQGEVITNSPTNIPNLEQFKQNNQTLQEKERSELIKKQLQEEPTLSDINEINQLFTDNPPKEKPKKRPKNKK